MMSKQDTDSSFGESSLVKISKLGQKRPYLYEFNQKTKWVAALVDEMSENSAKGKASEEDYCDIELELERRIDPTLRDVLLVTGSVEAKYSTQCVRCLKEMSVTQLTHLNAVSLEQAIADQHYPDEISIAYDQNEYDLYTHQKGTANLLAIIHEQIFLEYDQTPLHREDCKGLCQVCGQDLNDSECKHHRTLQ